MNRLWAWVSISGKKRIQGYRVSPTAPKDPMPIPVKENPDHEDRLRPDLSGFQRLTVLELSNSGRWSPTIRSRPASSHSYDPNQPQRQRRVAKTWDPGRDPCAATVNTSTTVIAGSPSRCLISIQGLRQANSKRVGATGSRVTRRQPSHWDSHPLQVKVV
jgi:hypothetical protein